MFKIFLQNIGINALIFGMVNPKDQKIHLTLNEVPRATNAYTLRGHSFM